MSSCSLVSYTDKRKEASFEILDVKFLQVERYLHRKPFRKSMISSKSSCMIKASAKLDLIHSFSYNNNFIRTLACFVQIYEQAKNNLRSGLLNTRLNSGEN